MRMFALIDLILQTILIIGGFAIASQNFNSFNEYAFLPYFVVGGWQIFSVIVHLSGEGTKVSKSRKIYFYSLLFMLVAMLIAGLAGGAILALFIPLFVSPVLAVMYWLTCYWEYQAYQRKANTTVAEELAIPEVENTTDQSS